MDKEWMNTEDKEQGFLELLNRFQPVLRRVCQTYAHSPEDREDLFQDMVYQLWRSYPTFRGESAAGTWVYRVALNTAISVLRKKPRTDKQVALEAAAELAASPSAEGSESGQIHRLYDMIQKLNPVDRALVLLYLEDLSYKELANILGLSESNVGVKLNRLKTKLFNFAKDLE